jgi:hypothetical protein
LTFIREKRGRIVMSSSDDFYADLHGFISFSDFTLLENYSALPKEWYIVVADIENSTDAIQKGRYKEVNAISTALVTVMLNATKPLMVPYVFGGDGATFCLPPSIKATIESALIAVKELARDAFDIVLRVGMVPMKHIKSEGYDVFIGKYQPSKHFQQAMFQGNGLDYAESLVKNPELRYLYHLDESKIRSKGDFTGFECRWNEIPSVYDETVAMIVQVTEDELEERRGTYEKVFQKIIEIYGNEQNHHPLREEGLNLTLSLTKLSSEARIRTAFEGVYTRIKYLAKLFILSYVGKYLMRRNITTEHVAWGTYKQRLIANTDYRKFDEVLRMVISGTRSQREELHRYLHRLYVEKKIIFGLHASPSALITCMVFDYDQEHIHFLDGSNGGYAMAAKAMKRQRKSMQSKS